MSYKSFVYMLSQPGSIVARVGTSSVDLEWEPVTNADHYILRVYLAAGDGSDAVTKTVTDSRTTVRGLRSDTDYKVQVVAGNNTMQSSPTYQLFHTDSPALTAVAEIEEGCGACVTSEDCLICKGMPICQAGSCVACSDEQAIPASSECYAGMQVCAVDTMSCAACSEYSQATADLKCQSGYGSNYVCEMETGRCQYSAPPPSPPPSTGLSIGAIMLLIVFGIILLGIIVGIPVYAWIRERRSKRNIHTPAIGGEYIM